MFKKSKSLSKTIGVLTSTITPFMFVTVSCSNVNNSSVNYYPLLPTYTGQADQLLALGIAPDYYPLQLNTTKPYEYLTNPTKFISRDKNVFASKFQAKLSNLLSNVKSYGESWWNQQALGSNESGSDPSYWQRQKGDVVLYEHYLLDDDEKIIDSAVAPSHDSLRAIETNFRWSRDPYTRLSKGIIYGLDLVNLGDKPTSVWSWIGGVKPNPQDVTINGDTVRVTQEDIDVIEKFMDVNVDNQGRSSWIYNSKFFAKIYHTLFLDNPDFQNSDFARWIIDTSAGRENAFDLDNNNNEFLKRLFAASTYTNEEKAAGIKQPIVINRNPDRAFFQAHHPIYEQQEGEIGAAPLFEGSMRDNMIYIYNVAYQLSNLANYGTVNGREYYNNVSSDKQQIFDANRDVVKSKLNSDQFNGLKNAFDKSTKISSDLHNRLQAMRSYFTDLGANDKVFGIVTIAPGHGMSTIQSMSKYSFLYRELGFKQPLPNSLSNIGATDASALALANQNGAIYNMDDNGWWWNLGNDTSTITRNLSEFNSRIDIGVITARSSDYSNIVSNQTSVKSGMINAFKNASNENDINSLVTDYDLWNEGIKTPFVFHMVLDEIISRVENWYKLTNPNQTINSTNENSAKSWGSYFEQEYVS